MLVDTAVSVPVEAAFRLQTHPAYGRCLVATRDINAGEEILRELPLVQTAPGASVDRELKAFCVAPSDVQRKVLELDRKSVV